MKNGMNHVMAAVAAVLAAGSACLAQTNTPEIEPNETKGTATIVAAMAPNDTISGTCTGVATAPGITSLDTWDITTTNAGSAGIYEYRLSINESTSTGRTMSLRGLTQTNGVINAGTDVAVLNVPPTTAHFVKWYANEQPSRVYLRLTGTTATTAAYTVTLQRFAVTPVAASNPVDAGPVYITTVGQTSVNTDLWLYDANLAAFADAGNDNETPAGGSGTSSFSRLQRPLVAGNYIIAISTSNLANNLASPSDDGNRNSGVMDFSNAICTSSATVGNTDLDLLIGNCCSGSSQFVSNTALFMEVKFVSFTVAEPTLPDPVLFTAGSASPAAVGPGVTTLLTVTASGVPTSVSADLSAFGLSSQALNDSGTDGDAAPGDNIWSYLLHVPLGQATGLYPISVTSTVGTSCVTPSRTINLNVTPPNNSCVNAVPITVGGAYPGTTVNALGAGGSSSNCNTIAGINPGVWYTFTETSPTPRRLIATLCDPVTNFDAQLVLYTGSCGAFTCVWGADTSGFGCPYQNSGRDNGNTGHSDIPSMVNWSPGAPGYKCTIPGTTYYLGVLNRVAGVGGDFVLHFEDSGETCEGLPPAHDLCGAARPLTTFPTWDLIYRDFATADNDVSCNAAANTVSRAGIWYAFTPGSAGNLFHAKIPDQTTVGSSFDSVVTVFSAAPDCSNLTEVACVDAVEGWVNRFTTPIAALTGGVTYYIEISSQSATASIPGGEYMGFDFVGTGPVCGTSDFNCDTENTDLDIEAFWACIAGSCPALPCTSSADFNGDGENTDLDIESFYSVLAGGPCVY